MNISFWEVTIPQLSPLDSETQVKYTFKLGRVSQQNRRTKPFFLGSILKKLIIIQERRWTNVRRIRQQGIYEWPDKVPGEIMKMLLLTPKTRASIRSRHILIPLIKMGLIVQSINIENFKF